MGRPVAARRCLLLARVKPRLCGPIPSRARAVIHAGRTVHPHPRDPRRSRVGSGGRTANDSRRQDRVQLDPVRCNAPLSVHVIEERDANQFDERVFRRGAQIASRGRKPGRIGGTRRARRVRYFPHHREPGAVRVFKHQVPVAISFGNHLSQHGTNTKGPEFPGRNPGVERQRAGRSRECSQRRHRCRNRHRVHSAGMRVGYDLHRPAFHATRARRLGVQPGWRDDARQADDEQESADTTTGAR